MLSLFRVFVLAALAGGCVAPSEQPPPGALSVSLVQEAQGVRYRLLDARFSLEGADRRDFSADGEDAITLEVPAGAYTLRLLDGWVLARVEDGTETALERVSLVSDNPFPILIEAGQTAHAAFRFELDGPDSPTGTGTLTVGIEVGEPDTGVGQCQPKLRISEIDYDQEGSDDAEFVELTNHGDCAQTLSDVSLELINGGDGKVYARYTLSDAQTELLPGERLVIGDPAVLALLPEGTASLPLQGGGLQNGPDALRLMMNDVVLDALAYEAAVGDVGEGSPAAADEGPDALARCPDGFDGDDNALDFALVPPSPGATNACGAER